MAHSGLRSKRGIHAGEKDPSIADVHEVLLEMFAASGEMDQLLLEHLDPRAWRAVPNEKNKREGRTLAAIFVHLHNCRLVWIRNSAPHLKCPAPLDPFTSTIKQARRGHRESSARCLEMLRDAWSDNPSRKVRKFSRGSWSQTWPAGATMFSYMFAHDAHHRGQVILLARQLGYRLPVKAAYGIWHWEKLWKACGFTTRPR
jgi:uncharacterized damage-inducible protein DinB